MSTALTGGSLLLAVCLVLALTLIVLSEITTRRASRRHTPADRDLEIQAEPDRPVPILKDYA